VVIDDVEQLLLECLIWDWYRRDSRRS
jgi:hypothetical protein